MFSVFANLGGAPRNTTQFDTVRNSDFLAAQCNGT